MTDPTIAFVLGLVAGLARSELRLPAAVIEKLGAHGYTITDARGKGSRGKLKALGYFSQGTYTDKPPLERKVHHA